MELKGIKPRKALNKAFLKVKPNRADIEAFKANLILLLDRTNDTESEEFHKNLVSDFLKDTYYKHHHFINTKGRNDLVIHNGPNANSTVGVILEAKKPTNRSEMVSPGRMNTKAFQELVLYYLRERISHKNLEVRHLVITNIYEWYVFDATMFDRLFAQNKALVKQFEDFEGGRLAGTNTDFFYRQIAEPFIEGIYGELEFTYFNLQDYDTPLRNADKKDDNILIALYKLLSPEHLLKLPFANDSNSLDKRFYSELLYIIGLTETKQGSKKLIERNKPDERHSGTLLEDSIIQLDSLDKISRLDRPARFGSSYDEKLFNVALELNITWINRILFLKLLEAQLISYHRFDRLTASKGDQSYAFLNHDKIKSYDDLNSLFFQVLARKNADRNSDVKQHFEKVPFLNSSLFEPTNLEHTTLFISNLRDDKTIPIMPKSVLKDRQGKMRSGELSTLEYLFEFLDSFDFSSEGSEEIQEENKTLISASVLGLIFEKINGYKDGSFFTPGFITMYMCRETIRKAVVQKFNEQASRLRGATSVSKRREIIHYNPILKERARDLRNNSTNSEIILWKELKGKFNGKYDFHRQKPLDHFIADFFCHELKLVIEIDGSIHDLKEIQEKDFIKESRLNDLGLNVLRFKDTEIYENLDHTLEIIRKYADGYEKGDLSGLGYDTPLNPLSRGDFSPLNPLSRGDFEDLDDVYEQIGDDRLFTRQQANEIVNSIKICDPAVGSGHFLVSALNEMIAVKNDLRILQDRNGRRLKEYTVEVVNDELTVVDDDSELYEYNPKSRESQRVQEALFHEKQTIIENCLFGVDINPNSVKICRLRLWIELLKNAYYTPESNFTELETLPNIDINIKCGNSLVSRFSIDADLKQALKKSKWTIDSYRMAIATYRNAENKEEKRAMEKLIADIKSDFRSEINRNDPKLKRLSKLNGELFNLTNQTQLFAESKAEQKTRQNKQAKLEKEIEKLDTEIEEIKHNKIYDNAFEWRFEFPEVLNDEGDFVGFDVVIGNPPYMRIQEIQLTQPDQKRYYDVQYRCARASYDLANIFFELAVNISKSSSNNAYIFPHKFFNAASSQEFRNYLREGQFIKSIAHFGANMVFIDADTYTCVAEFSKKPANGFWFQRFPFKSDFQKLMSEKEKFAFMTYEMLDEASKLYGGNQWILFDNIIGFEIFRKIYSGSKKFEDVFEGIFQGLATSKDGLYILELLNEEQFTLRVPISNKVYKLERTFFKPFLMGKDIQRFSNLSTNQYVFFPYKLEDDKAISVRLDELESNYPGTYEYVMDHSEDFKARERGKAGKMEFWYAYIYPKNLTKFEQQKLTSMEICANHPNVTFDNGNFYHTTKAYSWVKKAGTIESYEYLLAIANSNLLWWFLKTTGDTLQGDARTFKTNYLNPFPLPAQVSLEKETAISERVKEVLTIKQFDPTADTSAHEQQIDQLVYELYGLTEEEIGIVEGGLG